MVRAFSYFSHLLNIAEDEQQNRRRHAHAEAGSPRRPGSFAYALERPASDRRWRNVTAWFARARVSPVLTAHPTEVQRQSILECEREIARLLAAPQTRRARPCPARRGAAPVAHGDAAAHAARGGRRDRERARLFPADLPRGAAAPLRRARGGAAQRFDLAREPWLPPFLTVGTWVGGDRDGNPNVGAATLRDRSRAAGAAHPRALPRGGEPARARARASRAPDEDAAPQVLELRRALGRRARPTGATSRTGAWCPASTPARRHRARAGGAACFAATGGRACALPLRPPSLPRTWS